MCSSSWQPTNRRSYPSIIMCYWQTHNVSSASIINKNSGSIIIKVSNLNIRIIQYWACGRWASELGGWRPILRGAKVPPQGGMVGLRGRRPPQQMLWRNTINRHSRMTQLHSLNCYESKFLYLKSTQHFVSFQKETIIDRWFSCAELR